MDSTPNLLIRSWPVNLSFSCLKTTITYHYSKSFYICAKMLCFMSRKSYTSIMKVKFSLFSRIYRKFEVYRYSDFPKILGDLPDFPSSSATYKQYKFLTLKGAKKNYQTIFDISKQKKHQ
jgi:hypothetical protein